MDESYSEPDRAAAELAGQSLEWETPRTKIESMTHEQLVQEVILLNEKVRRLYEVAMLPVHSQAANQPVKPEDINHILNPESLN